MDPDGELVSQKKVCKQIRNAELRKCQAKVKFMKSCDSDVS